MSKPEKLESSAERAFRKWCQTQGCLCKKLILYGEKGWPDRTVLLPDGRVVFIELKRKRYISDTSAQQRFWIAKLKSLGHSAYVVDTLEDAQEIVRAHLHTTPVPANRD